MSDSGNQDTGKSAAETAIEGTGALAPIQRSAADPAVLTIDYALYEDYLADADLTDDQKHQFLDALWSIICAFVDLGFGIHPLQQCDGAEPIAGPDMWSEPCGQNDDLRRIIAAEMLDSGMAPTIETQDVDLKGTAKNPPHAVTEAAARNGEPRER